MTKEIKISVVTPCFNAGKLIEDLANSLSDQTFKEFEWCIADDGSNEETRVILRDIEASVGFPIKLMCFEKQGGNVCRNRGFDASSGRFVKFVDADDLLDSRLLESQYEIAKENPSAIVVSPTTIVNQQGDVVRQNCLDELLLEDPLRSFLKRASFMHGGCLLPRELVIRIGGWDESLVAGQDLDFFRRVLASGEEVKFAESFFCYRQHDDAPRISSLDKNRIAKFTSHLKGLDQFREKLESESRLNQYEVELAQNYDLWGLKALALGVPFADDFFLRAKALSSASYRSGSWKSKLMRSIFGDRLTGKFIRSSVWASCRSIMGRLAAKN